MSHEISSDRTSPSPFVSPQHRALSQQFTNDLQEDFKQNLVWLTGISQDNPAKVLAGAQIKPTSNRPLSSDRSRFLRNLFSRQQQKSPFQFSPGTPGRFVASNAAENNQPL